MSALSLRKICRNLPRMIVATSILVLSIPVFAQDKAAMPSTTSHRMHVESARQHVPPPSSAAVSPPIPGDMTLDEVFEYAEKPPPADYPDPVPDDRVYAFALIEQLEYRLAADNTPDHLGWEAQGWIGGDFNKFWWKSGGQAVFDGPDVGETETDLLYSRMITPFWNLQLGAQHANEWSTDDDEDRWSGVIAFQGLAPYKFELDNSLYISEDGDVTLEIEGEYDVRVTQRMVLQPRAELAFAAQDITERDLGAGLTDGNLDLRLRYEIEREFAPYIGVRYQFLVGETSRIAKAGGGDTEQLLFLAGFRVAF